MNYPFFYYFSFYSNKIKMIKKNILLHIVVFFYAINFYAQRDSLNVGDRYSEDQLYASISYVQLFSQPISVDKSNFSYSISTGFIKDITLNKKGSISIAAGLGYGFTTINHDLKVDEINNRTTFNTADFINSNIFNSHSLEIPLELRWRTSTANKYSFWRVYTGLKLLYDLSHTFKYSDIDNNEIKYNNISSFSKLQYGVTLSAGYDEFNIHIFYGLTPIFDNGILNNEVINSKTLKFGLIYYFL